METTSGKSESTDTSEMLGPNPKAARVENEREKEHGDENEDLGLSSLSGFGGFTDVEMLRCDVQKKVAFIQAKMSGRTGDAVVILEKPAFTDGGVKRLLSSSTEWKFRMRNDIYRQYDGYPQRDDNLVQTTVIYPASDELLAKFGSDETNLVAESPHLYQTVTRRFIEQKAQSLQWVYNILDHKAEVERIVFEDPHPETGFILLPDLKWDQKTTDNLYLLGICHLRGITCLRDLTDQHLPLLKNMLKKGRAAIGDRYHVLPRQVKVYVHYQPSYYHFHVHYVHIKLDDKGGVVGRAHLLEDVIDNIDRISSSYYQVRTLVYSLRNKEQLWKMMEEAEGVNTTSD